MNFKYKLFAFLFNFFRFFISEKNIKKNNNISFIMDEIDEISSNSNLEYIKQELDSRDNYKYNYIYKSNYSFDKSKSFKDNFRKFFSLFSFFLIKTYKLSKSKYVFLNDNFFPIAYMNFNNKSKLIQLWHAPGAFKKFGFDSTDDENIRELIKLIGNKTEYLIVTSSNISDIYEKAFQVNEKKILAFGIPRIDYYFDKKNINQYNIRRIREKLEKKYPKIKGKKIVLYAPTFRENQDLNEKISINFDGNLFESNLNDEYCLVFKSHPKYNIPMVEHSIDLSKYDNIQELLLVSDILITDYSSIMIEFAILFKPIIFYPFDLKYYSSNERGFYFDYDDVPGPIAKDTQEIIEIIKKNNFNIDKIKKFVFKNYDYLDNKSSKRIVDFILSRD
ncbi:CDP-glycerol glycerophosphotransferase family protein [Methanobrevibacter arboriphilus]|uniref:CDP-glycerol glycerophosphotransferase family protein n=1 Tax=Methanobrevibacter arboriphilus TaxID=39441 RepID=UPI0005B29A32|nr:CDP-glycerol glycerophosphotransferase family protein [Methanobrevibacter arboriphilus]